MSITRPQAMTQEEKEAEWRRIQRQGASITVLDPRVTSAQTWLLTTVGLAIVAFLGWNIQSIQNLNQTLAVMLEQNRFRDDQIKELRLEMVRKERADRMERHIESVDGRVTVLEKKNR